MSKYVKCIDNAGYDLTINKTYKVIFENFTSYKIYNDDNHKCYFYKSRFIKVNAPEELKMNRYIKCIESHELVSLTINKIYKLTKEEDDQYYYFVDDDGDNVNLSKEFFIEVDGEKIEELEAPHFTERLTPDMINHPSHYIFGGIECLDAIKGQLGTDGFIAFLRGQIAKYNWRIMHKNNSLEDAKKIQFYTNKLVDELEIK